jgi:hypothetical protein
MFTEHRKDGQRPFQYLFLTAAAWGALYYFISDRVLQMMEGYDRFSEFFKY